MALPFTGERFTPECVRDMWLEHWHRYAFASRFAVGRRILDVACGEGYGAALLARRARSVIAGDIDEATLAHAAARYCGQSNLRFEKLDATALDAIDDASVDLVTSFETLEHLEAHDAMLAGFTRVLADDGLLVISTPDKRVYSDLTGYRNEFHVRELYRHEFEALIARHFGAVRVVGQKLAFQSLIFDESNEPATASAMTMSKATGEVSPRIELAPLYLIAICAKHAAAMPSGLNGLIDLFGDREESVLDHYQHEIRKNMAAGAIVEARDAEIARLRALLQSAGIDPDKTV